MVMTKFFFYCPKCGRPITFKMKSQPEKPVLILDLRCFTRLGVGCGKWVGRISTRDAFKTQTVKETPRRYIRRG
jgi:hypothetical protein